MPGTAWRFPDDASRPPALSCMEWLSTGPTAVGRLDHRCFSFACARTRDDTSYGMGDAAAGRVAEHPQLRQLHVRRGCSAVQFGCSCCSVETVVVSRSKRVFCR